MSTRRCPIEVLVVAFLYIIVGTVGLVRHFPRPIVVHQDDIWILLTELLAVVAGVFMLRGHNWARWLAIAWIVFHVILSWPVVAQLIVHSLITILIAALLFRRVSREFFAGSPDTSSGTA
jgi:hypothetical protein